MNAIRDRIQSRAGRAVLAVLLLAPLARLDAAPVPEAGPGLTREQRIQWWREARFGMFIHWGLYSIPAGVWKDKVHATGYSEWIMFGEKIPAKEYEKLAGRFKPREVRCPGLGRDRQAGRHEIRGVDHQTPRWLQHVQISMDAL